MKHPSRFQAARDPQVQLGLPARQPLGRSSLQGRQLDIVTRGPKMFDRARAFTPGPHDLHRGGPRGGLHRPHVSHPGRLRPDPSVQIPPEPQPKPQLNEPPLHLHPESEPSQVTTSAVNLRPLDPQKMAVTHSPWSAVLDGRFWHGMTFTGAQRAARSCLGPSGSSDPRPPK
jgi:hypothetical protein